MYIYTFIYYSYYIYHIYIYLNVYIHSCVPFYACIVGVHLRETADAERPLRCLPVSAHAIVIMIVFCFYII